MSIFCTQNATSMRNVYKLVSYHVTFEKCIYIKKLILPLVLFRLLSTLKRWYTFWRLVCRCFHILVMHFHALLFWTRELLSYFWLCWMKCTFSLLIGRKRVDEHVFCLWKFFLYLDGVEHEINWELVEKNSLSSGYDEYL